jgi:hypothetical protein
VATDLPIIRGLSAALYPFVQTFIAQTSRSDGQNGSATRSIKGPPLMRIELPTNRIAQADKNIMRGAFTDAKGQLAGDLQLTTYQLWNNMSFDSDEFTAIEPASTCYNVRWSLTQTLPQNFAPGSPVPAYPRFSNGAISKLPYTQKRRFQTIANKMPSGPKYVYGEFGAGLNGFPGALGLMSWEMDNHNILDTEVNTLLAHFLTNWGDALPFTFTDESNTTSATSVTVGTGSKTFTVDAGLTYAAGALVQVQSLGNGSMMNGTVTSYAGTTLVVNVTSIGGSGTFADWGVSPTYPHVYYASPEFTITWEQLDAASIKTTLVQMF